MFIFYLASWKCSGTSCTTGAGLDPAKPFCGNEASSLGEDEVDIGECGHCQVMANGGGAAADCMNGGGSDCPADSSCFFTGGAAMVCCTSGSCAADQNACT